MEPAWTQALAPGAASPFGWISSAGAAAAFAVGIAFLLDAAVGEPPRAMHPVAWFGRLVAPVDREWRRPGLVGTIALGAPLLAAAVAWGVVRATPTVVDAAVDGFGLAGTAPAWTGELAIAVAAGVVLFVTLSRRLLLVEARTVIDTSVEDPTIARDRLPSLAGRDPSSLSPGEVRSAAVESAAENLADGLVAPLVAFALGAAVSLPLAAAAAAWVKAVNTLDSMLGYRSKPVGTPSAGLDDLVMAVPARVSALLLAVVARDPGALSRAAQWVKAPSSPNSGWPMATLAAAIDVRLEKPGSYVINPDAGFPDVDRGMVGVALVDRAALLAFLFAGGWSLGLGGAFG
ncbi:MAG: CobD/CbiB family cobalamin biosynthesis protein [Haloferacaceae archaeon]